MTIIPKYQGSRDTRIPSINIPSGGVGKIGVSRASSPSIGPAVSPNLRYLQSGLENLSEGLYAVAEVYKDREETARRAEVLDKEAEMQQEFQQIQNDYATKTEGQAIGLSKDLYEKREELREKVIPNADELDSKSLAETNQLFEFQYQKLMNWTRSHELTQFNAARKSAEKNIVATGVAKSLETDVGDIEAIEEIATESVAKYDYLHRDELTDEQLIDVRKALIEDFLVAALPAWLSENPSVAVDLWDKNKEYFKKNIPNKYNALEGHVKAARKNAQTDKAITYLRETFGDNYAAIVAETEKSSFIEKYLKGDETAALSIGSTYAAKAMRKMSMLAEKKQIESDKFMLNTVKGFTNDKGEFDSIAALDALEQGFRDGAISHDVWQRAKNNWERPFISNTELNNIYNLIDNGTIRNTTDIYAQCGNKVNAAVYLSYLKQVENQRKKGMEVDYVDQVRLRFRQLAADKRYKNDIILSDETLFMHRIRQEMTAKNYTYLDERVLTEISKDMLSEVIKHPSFGDKPVPAEGITTWSIFGEETGRKWEFMESGPKSKGSKQKEEGKVSEALSFIPITTATGGTLRLTKKDYDEVVKLLGTLGKEVHDTNIELGWTLLQKRRQKAITGE